MLPDAGQHQARPAVGVRPAAQERADLLEVAPVGGLVGHDPTELAVHRVVEDPAPERVAVDVGSMGSASRPRSRSRSTHSAAGAVANAASRTRLRLAGDRVVGDRRAAARTSPGAPAASGSARQPRPRLVGRAAPARATRRRRTRRSGSRVRSPVCCRVELGTAHELAVALEHAALQQHPGAEQARRHPLAPAARRPGVQAGEDAGGGDPPARPCRSGSTSPAMGSLPAPPTARSNPVTACMSASLPGNFARGPVAPKALAWQ